MKLSWKDLMDYAQYFITISLTYLWHLWNIGQFAKLCKAVCLPRWNFLRFYCDKMMKRFGEIERQWNISSLNLGRVTHICVSRLTITGSDNGVSPGRRQAIIWTNAGILLLGPLGTNFSENSIEILTFSFMKKRLKVSSAKWRPFCLGLNVLTHSCLDKMAAIFRAVNVYLF